MKFTIATDGSFTETEYVSKGAGVLRVEDTCEEFVKSSYSNDKRFVSSCNIGGEYLGCILGLYNLCIYVNHSEEDVESAEITILHDYQGLSKCILGGLSACHKQSSVLFYTCYTNLIKYLRTMVPNVSVKFEWTPGHSGERLNELADFYAGQPYTSMEDAHQLITILEELEE